MRSASYGLCLEGLNYDRTGWAAAGAIIIVVQEWFCSTPLRVLPWGVGWSPWHEQSGWVTIFEGKMIVTEQSGEERGEFGHSPLNKTGNPFHRFGGLTNLCLSGLNVRSCKTLLFFESCQLVDEKLHCKTRSSVKKKNCPTNGCFFHPLIITPHKDPR